MKAKKSTGFDNISSWLIKKLNTSICNPLAVVINKSLEQGCFPEKLKIAKVVPIYKAKNREQFNNYRPISLLPSLSKIYEKLMYKRLNQSINQSINQTAYITLSHSRYKIDIGYSLGWHQRYETCQGCHPLKFHESDIYI